ncbi:MAG: 3-methyl-2-oxobutanoate dehydrogenase subunit VorB [Eubacteriales bacterium]|jgi:2-oxoglutarate ferredoxin oxidoreductase subunit alpha|nr:3-methyl-2-oxobutanoate dehydrogenase subunit VorB [Eubacteriales bacterium]MDD3072964.1 3-methyl-2-oxobutanoate dehydrogenase subunit VorB [Eubacteriales bacterium]MDD4078490.1 3-methyl-2-oxobutanoate dehydrogenase subunit VorB [Eubacteriales bacterium]MDD4768378.1 3-methyl-2-oxobutanoate dehydrogenase subunit VorB [Eubacteriales bacterium]HCX78040.1 3-methyl-2-oxobutanoate dehydrogenase subunit beta [Bacillota bacterium]
MAKQLMKGNEAIGEAAIQAGCRYFFGYPITPQNEVPEYMSRRLPEVGGVFLQAESEVAAINMVYGAAGAGARVMTSSSSPGISLKQEGISYIAGSELPCVIINIIRGGPGLGGIQPAQSDYFQATKGGGHGDYNLFVFAPASVQEMVDLIMESFDIADYYRNPVMIMGDGTLGQMMEPVEFKAIKKRDLPPKDWATTGCVGREHNIINSLALVAENLEKHNWKLQEKYKQMKENEQRWELYKTEDAELVMVAYGTTARIVKSVVNKLREQGIKAGLLRPITIFPYPEKAFALLPDSVKAFLTVEMSAGQMVQDVRLAVNGKRPVHFCGRTGGIIPTPAEITKVAMEIMGGER